MNKTSFQAVGVVTALSFILAMVCSVQAQEPNFTETFDDPTMPGWEHSPSARIAEGRLLIEGEGLAFHGGMWSDAIYSFKFLWNGDGAVAFHYQINDEGSYMVRLSGEGVQLLFDQKGIITDIAANPTNVPRGDWIQIRVQKSGEVHTVFLNDHLVIEAIDSQELPPGGVLLRVEGDVVGSFDDLVVEPGEDSPNGNESVPSLQPDMETASRLSISELQWLRLGGPPGGLGYDIRYNFDNPNVWYVTDANAGVHISRDNGLTWQQSNTGIETVGGAAGDSVPIFSLTVDPHNPQIIWAGTDMSGRIYKSDDGGNTWMAKDQGIVHEHEILLSFRGFTVDPRTSDIVYAMGELQKPGNNVWGLGVGGVVYKTIDGGEHWTRIWYGTIPSSLARYMWIDPRNPDVLYVSTGIFDRGAIGETDRFTDPDPFGGLGVLKSMDGGLTWRVLGEQNGLDFRYIGSLYMHPDNPDILFAAAGHVVSELAFQYYWDQGHSPLGIYRTVDGGETWQQVLEPEGEILVQAFSSVEICPSDSNIIYAGSEVAVYRSEDGGSSWSLVSGGIQGWGPPGVRAGWPIDMQCDPRDTNRIFTNNYSGGNFLSEDGGVTWKNASTGYSGAQIIGVAVDPFNPARVYAAGRSGVWVSNDAGFTWSGIHNPSETQALAGGEWGGVAFDPENEDHIILGGQLGFLEWTPGASKWIYHNPPEEYFPETSEIEFAPSDPHIVYAVSANHNSMIHSDVYESGQGIVVSRDGGSNWEAITGSQFSSAVLTDVSVDPTDANVVYVASQIGLFNTTDGGGSWREVTSLVSNKPVRTVAVNPVNPNRVLAGVQFQGLFLSEDGGSSWRQIAAGLEPNGIHRDIIFDPTNANIVYVGDITSGVYQSTDGGETWVKLPQGLTNRAVTTLSISSDGLHLYAGTSGGGVFRLDLNGQPPVPKSQPEPEPFQPQLATEAPSDFQHPVEPGELDTESGSGGLPCLGGLALPLLVVITTWNGCRQKKGWRLK